MIKLKNVSYTYKDSTIPSIKNMTLMIPTGQVVVITGKSGSGKTTFTRLLNSLIPHYYEGEFQGEVLIDHHNTKEQPLWKQPHSVGSVLQDPRSQFFGLHVQDEVVFGAENHALPATEINERLIKVSEEVQIRHLLPKSLYELSSGEKQRVALASVRMMAPNVYVFDEPSSNLDEEMAGYLKRFIAKLKKQGATVIVSEHRLHYLLDVIDRLIVLEAGGIVADILQTEVEDYFKKTGEARGLRVFTPLVVNVVPPERLEETPIVAVNQVHYRLKKAGFTLNVNDLVAYPGEVIAIVGNNGAGKTTFARTLAGFIKPQKGSIAINGKKMSSRQRLAHSWFVAQDTDYQLFAETVMAELLLGNEKQPQIMEDAECLLEQMGLAHLKARHPMTLSGGEKQRLALAIGLIRKRDCLILDEPTSGLDGYHMAKVATQLRSDLFKQRCVFVVTHDEAFVASCCTRVIRIETGEIISDKRTEVNQNIKKYM